MGKFLNGLFVGIGIGLLIAPQTGEETRRLIMDRVASLRKSVSSDDDQPISIDTHPSQITSFPSQPAQPVVPSFTQPQSQEVTSIPLADTRATVGSQSVNTSGSNRTTTNTAQPAVTTNARFAPGANLEQQASTEESENTAKLPNLSNSSKPNTANIANQNANRKASTGTQNTNKSRDNK